MQQCCSEKVVSITYSGCVCVSVCISLGIQHAMRMRHIVELWPARLCNIFSILSHEGKIFFKKKLLNIKCVF